MGLKCRMVRSTASRRGATVANSGQLLAELRSGLVGASVGVIQIVDPCHNAGPQHRRGKATAFLVGPIGNLNRPTSVDAECIQGANHFQSSHHSIHTIKPAARRLGIQMAAYQNRIRFWLISRACRKYVSHLIDGYSAALLTRPPDEQIPGRTIPVSKRLSIATSRRGPADLGHCHQTIPKSTAVNSRFWET